MSPAARRTRAIPLCLTCCGGSGVVALLVLAASGYLAMLRGETLHGWALFVHVVAGAVFVAALALVALASLRAIRLGVLGALLFVTLLFGALAAAPVAASMYGLPGTLAAERLLDVHRWAGLAAFVTGIVTAALAVRRRGGSPHTAATPGHNQPKTAAVTRP